jgi:HlyD family secretion protein
MSLNRKQECVDSGSMGQKRQWLERRSVRWAVVAVVVILVGLTAFSLRGRKVPASRVLRRPLIETAVVNGRVLAQSKSEVGSKVSGTVERVFVQEGDRVRVGQPLVQLNDREERAQADQARQSVREAEARLATLQNSTSRRNSEAVQQAELRALEAEREAQRFGELARSGLVAAADLESASRRAKIARSEADSAIAAARATAAQGSDAVGALAAVEAARANRAAAEARLAQTTIAAPADGVVLTRSTEPGASVAPGKTLLIMALDSETLLLAQPDEKNLAAFRVGQVARASADAYPAEHFDAVVQYIAPNVDLLRGTFDVKLRVPKPPPYLKTDMTLSIEVETARKPSALVVPADAVRDTARAPWVLAIAGGRTERRDVTLGIRGDNLVEITSGLREGDVVVRSSAVRAGERVRPDLASGS